MLKRYLDYFVHKYKIIRICPIPPVQRGWNVYSEILSLQWRINLTVTYYPFSDVLSLQQRCIILTAMYYPYSYVLSLKWHINLSVTYYPYSDVLTLQWRIILTVTYYPYSDVLSVQWRIILTVTYYPYSDVLSLQWRLSIGDYTKSSSTTQTYHLGASLTSAKQMEKIEQEKS